MDREKVIERTKYIDMVSKKTVINETVNFKVGQSVCCQMIQGIVNKTDKTPDDKVLNSVLKGAMTVFEDIKRFLD